MVGKLAKKNVLINFLLWRAAVLKDERMTLQHLSWNGNVKPGNVLFEVTDRDHAGVYGIEAYSISKDRTTAVGERRFHNNRGYCEVVADGENQINSCYAARFNYNAPSPTPTEINRILVGNGKREYANSRSFGEVALNSGMYFRLQGRTQVDENLVMKVMGMPQQP
jgi:hypothetical protein